MNLREAIREIAKDPVSFRGIRLGNVVSVNDSARTCVVNVLDSETDIEGVRLHSTGESANGMYYKPAIDSLVGIMPLFSFEYCVVLYSDLEEISFLDGSYGGLTKTQELKTQLDKTNSVVQAIVDTLQQWTPVSNDGGAALKAFFPTKLLTKTVGDFSGIENDKVTHGTI